MASSQTQSSRSRVGNRVGKSGAEGGQIVQLHFFEQKKPNSLAGRLFSSTVKPMRVGKLHIRGGQLDAPRWAKLPSFELYGCLPYHRVMEVHTMSSASTARLEARISTDLHALLKRAAQLQGRTMTDFVVSAVQNAAQQALEQAEFVRLSLADQECFAQALLDPPKPNAALQRAFKQRNKLLRSE